MIQLPLIIKQFYLFDGLNDGKELPAKAIRRIFFVNKLKILTETLKRNFIQTNE